MYLFRMALAAALFLLADTSVCNAGCDPTKLINSTVGIVHVFDEGPLAGKFVSGSGVLLAGDTVLTLGHVVEGLGLTQDAPTKVSVFRQEAEGNGPRIGVETTAHIEKVVPTDFYESLVIIKLDEGLKEPLILAIRASAPSPNEKLVALGYRHTSLRTAVGRYVGPGTAQYRNGMGVGWVLAELTHGRDRLALDEGSSGGLIADCESRIVGLYSATLQIARKNLQQGSFATDATPWEHRPTTPKGEPNIGFIPTTVLAASP